MAEVLVPVAFVTLIDSKKKLSSMEFNISAASAKAYVAAADTAARAATQVGALIDAAAGMSRAAVVGYGVRYDVKSDTVATPAPGSEIFHSQKLAVLHRAGIRNYAQNIPAWDPDAVTITGEDGSAALTASQPQQTQDFQAAFNAVVIGVNGVASTLVSLKKIR